MKSNKYEIVDVETLDDVCDIIWNNTRYLVKQNKKLNRKINTIAIIFGGFLFGSLNVLAEEIQNLKIKCK